MVGSQIANLTPNLSFGHNLCVKCPNGSCEPMLNIYVRRNFQSYKELFNPMGFGPFNHSLKIWKSIKSPIPKVGTHLGVRDSFPHILAHSKSMKCDSCPSHLVYTFASPCFSREPKVKVVTLVVMKQLKVKVLLMVEPLEMVEPLGVGLSTFQLVHGVYCSCLTMLSNSFKKCKKTTKRSK
jgi:hypothetical protein